MSKVKHGLTLAHCMALGVAWDYADEQNKSTEWMLQYMQDVAGVSLSAVNYYLRETPNGLTPAQRDAYWRKRFNPEP